MEKPSELEVWQRGPVDGVPGLLQPVAHALLQAVEDARRETKEFPAALLWNKPGGVASVGFHLLHMRGVVDRLFTYAKGEMLSELQMQELRKESVPGEDPATALVDALARQVDAAVEQLKTTDVNSLTDHRGVGRKQIPSTVIGLMFHAAEHVQRHVGQLIVTARIVKAQARD